MNKRAIWGIILAVTFAVTMTLVPAFAAGHVILSSTSATIEDFATLDVSITVSAAIPTDGSAGLFGYGVFTDGNNNVLALTSHKCFSDHPDQSDVDCVGDPTPETDTGPEFHAHILDLQRPTAACRGFDAEVDIGSTLRTGNAFTPSYTISVSGATITVVDVPKSDLGDLTVESIAAFTITGVPRTDSSVPIPVHLCLDVITAMS